MARQRDKRIRERRESRFVTIERMEPLSEPPVARVSWVLRPRAFVRIALERPEGQPHGPSAGMSGFTELFTDPDRTLREIWLDLHAPLALPAADLHLRVAAHAEPATIVVGSFRGLSTREVALHSAHATASFVERGPWEGVDGFRILAFAAGVYVGVESASGVLAFVTVLRPPSEGTTPAGRR